MTNPADHLSPVPEKLEYIYKNIEEIIAQRPANIPLIGFCGAPLTTLCYMVQGISSNPNFPDAINVITSYSIHYTKLYDICMRKLLRTIPSNRGLKAAN